MRGARRLVGRIGEVRQKGGIFRYDRAAIRQCLEAEGLDAARAKWPRDVVDPIARLLGMTRRYRPSDVWRPEWTPLLGTKPDQTLAAELGVASSTVHVQRRMLGLPAFRSERKQLDVPDTELSLPLEYLTRKYRVSNQRLMRERKRRGIESDPRGRRTVEQSELRRVAIRAMRTAFPHVTQKAMAGALGISFQAVQQLMAGDFVRSDEATGSACEHGLNNQANPSCT